MSEHAPGPWRATNVRNMANAVAVVVAEDGKTICRCGITEYLEGGRWIDSRTRGTNEAHARLIAAALDLLEEHRRWAEAFGNALSLARGGDYSGVDALARDTDINAPMTAPVIASAAIAKAEGRPA